MFRHVVMFRWSPDSTEMQRSQALEALGRLADQVRHLGQLSVGADAGISKGNFDAGVVVDFPSREDYLTYAAHPAHVECVTNYIRPILLERVAVQYEL